MKQVEFIGDSNRNSWLSLGVKLTVLRVDGSERIQGSERSLTFLTARRNSGVSAYVHTSHTNTYYLNQFDTMELSFAKRGQIVVRNCDEGETY